MDSWIYKKLICNELVAIKIKEILTSRWNKRNCLIISLIIQYKSVFYIFSNIYNLILKFKERVFNNWPITLDYFQ